MENKLLTFLCDDDPSFREIMYSYLERNNNLVLKDFGTGEELFEALESETPDVIILDYRLNLVEDVESGLEVLKKLKSKNIQSKIITISGDNETELLEEFRSSNANFIHKDHTILDKLNNELNNIHSTL